MFDIKRYDIDELTCLESPSGDYVIYWDLLPLIEELGKLKAENKDLRDMNREQHSQIRAYSYQCAGNAAKAECLEERLQYAEDEADELRAAYENLMHRLYAQAAEIDKLKKEVGNG